MKRLITHITRWFRRKGPSSFDPAPLKPAPSDTLSPANPDPNPNPAQTPSPKKSAPAHTFTVEQQARRRTLRSFAGLALFGFAGWKGWTWLKDQPLDHGIQGGIQEPLRKVLDANETIFSPTLSPSHLAKTYPRSAALTNVRTNGDVGLNNSGFDPGTWKLQVTRTPSSPNATEDIFSVSLDEIRRLPKTDIVFDFKCIEGWSMITHWGGVRFSDFMDYYKLEKEGRRQYVALSTPDEEYYVGIDMASALHPQTMLCYEMNGKPLPVSHGYPLRLIIPVKYGIKNLKRIGSLSFSDKRPPDYWFERGYDYYSGL